MCSARRSARRLRNPRAIRSRSCRRPRCSSASIACSACAARTAAPRRAPSCPPECRGEPSARACRQRSSPSRSGTASRGATLRSSCASSSVAVWRAERSMPSCRVRAPRSRSLTPGFAITCAPRPPSTSTRPAGARPASGARSGACSAGRRRSFASPRVATSARPRRCSARTSPASPARTAGGPFDYLDPKRRQLCWAHLVRDFTAHSEGLGAQKDFGAAGLEIAGRLFAAWGEFRGDADRNRLLERIDPLQEELRALLEEAARKAARNRRQRSFAKNLLKLWPALWTFALVDGVEPTNNHAERGLRGAVILRKLSHGSQSEEGERIVERLLSASITCRLQKRSLFTYLTDVLTAKIRGDPIPLLA